MKRKKVRDSITLPSIDTEIATMKKAKMRLFREVDQIYKLKNRVGKKHNGSKIKIRKSNAFW